MKQEITYAGKRFTVETPDSILTMNQTLSREKIYTEDGEKYKIIMHISYDDKCRNGYNTFSATGEIYRARANGRFPDDCETCGCIHKDIAKHFPECKKYIKWHLCSSDKPMYYLQNFFWNVGDKDCWGLRKGEKEQFKNKDGVLSWKLEDEPKIYIDSTEKPAPVILNYVPWCKEGKGKKRDFDAARSTAIWPDATEEELLNATPEILIARLPGLMEEFKRDMEELGFKY